MPTVEGHCEICGREFVAKPSDHKRFCSVTCKGKAQSIAYQSANNPHWKGGLVERECQQCGVHFKRRDDEPGKYCSWACHNAARRTRVAHVCEQCGATFECIPAQVRQRTSIRFCSKACHGRWRAAHLNGENSPNWKGGAASPSGQKQRNGTYYHQRRARQESCRVNDFTEQQWQDLLEYFGHRCGYCGRDIAVLDREHMTPLSRGGDHTLDNIVPACRRCNVKKNRRTLLEFVASGAWSECQEA